MDVAPVERLVRGGLGGASEVFVHDPLVEQAAREHELGQLREGAGGVWYNFSHIEDFFCFSPSQLAHE